MPHASQREPDLLGSPSHTSSSLQLRLLVLHLQQRQERERGQEPGFQQALELGLGLGLGPEKGQGMERHRQAEQHGTEYTTMIPAFDKLRPESLTLRYKQTKVEFSVIPAPETVCVPSRMALLKMIFWCSTSNPFFSLMTSFTLLIWTRNNVTETAIMNSS